MKFLVLSFLITALLAIAAAMPATQLDPETVDAYLAEEEAVEYSEPDERGVRLTRATCDLLSISLPIGSLNHAACAAHCLAKRKGFRGGRCKDGVCHCRY